MAAALPQAIFVRLFTAGIQRLAGSIFQRIVRLRKIDAALKGEAAKNPEIKTAIEDFEIVLGTYRGEFTTDVNRFLRDLEKSGVLEAIAQQALIRKRTENLAILFDKAFHEVMPNHHLPSERLYEQLCLSFEITIRELTKDPVLSDVLVEMSENLERRLDSIEACLASLSGESLLSDEGYQENLARLSRGLLQTYRDIRIETVKSGAKLVPIDRIYIPPQLRRRDVASDELKRTVRSLLRHDRSSPDQAPMRFSNRRDIENTISSMSFREFQTTFNRVIILGDPGGGKSTLCQKVCYDLTRNFVASLQMANLSEKVPPQNQKLAIRVVLRKFEQARISNPQLDLFEYIVRDSVNLSGLDYNQAKKTLGRILETGQAILAFDGLDEILDTSGRRDFVALVESFCDRYALNPAIVTSRIVGYQDAPLARGFEEIVLSQLTSDEVREYLKKFLQVVAARSPSDAEAEADRFIIQTNENASDLRRNPLLLGLMAFLFHAKGDVPSNRPEIYSDCATLMFDKWDKNRGILPDVPSDFERAELFSEIASQMFENVELRAGVTKDWLKGRVLDFFYNLYLDRARAIKSGKTITDFLIGRAWVMSEIGDGIFAFTHQTFLEYYFARGLDGRFDTVKQLLSELQPRILRSEWDVVAHLALQLKTQGTIRRQDEALQMLTEKIGKFKTPKYDLAIRRFAAKSLEYLNGTEEEVERLISALANIDVHRGGALDRVSILCSALSAANHRRRLVEERVPQLMTDLVFSDETPSSELVKALGPRPYGRSVQRLSQLVPDELSQLIRANAKRRIIERSEKNGIYASIAFQWYGHYIPGTLNEFGLEPFTVGYLPETGVRGTPWAALAASKAYAEYFRPQDYSSDPIVRFLEDIANVDPDRLILSKPGRTGQGGHIPLEVWLTALNDIADHAQALRGVLILFIMSVPEFLSNNMNVRKEDFGPRISEGRYLKLRKLVDSTIERGGDQYRLTIEKVVEHAQRPAGRPRTV